MANVQHASLTGADLHEPKGADSANADEVYAADGLGSGAWTALKLVGGASLYGAFTVTAAQNVYETIDNLTQSGSSTGLTVSTANGTFTVDTGYGGSFVVAAMFRFLGDAIIDPQYTLSAAVDGTEEGPESAGLLVVGATDPGYVILFTVVDAADAEAISVSIKETAGGTNAAGYAQIFVAKVG